MRLGGGLLLPKDRVHQWLAQTCDGFCTEGEQAAAWPQLPARWQVLQLEDVRTELVGDESVRGISGGQRK